ncbi:MAG TPA: alpha-ribazole phosphatase [Syntrophaceae bacterium]|nr:alpha-ribazole phosphatase [Syntrophaceae bacterium]
MEKVTLYLVRHGECEHFDKCQFFGHTDIDLTCTGIRQMKSMAQRLEGITIDQIYSSDLKRASKSASIIASHWNKIPRNVPQFREVNFGKWEGLTWEEIEKQFPGSLEARFKDVINYKIPGGESLEDLRVRVLGKLREILKGGEGKSILLVTHGGVNRVILCDALGLSLENLFRIEQDYGCLNIIDYFRDTMVVKLVNG